MARLRHIRRVPAMPGLILVLLLGVLTGTAASQTRELRIVDASGLPGQAVTVAVELVASGSENAVGFSLAWDPLQLGAPEVVIGSGLTAASININANNAAAGRLGVILALPANQAMVAGVRQLVRITFVAAAGQTQTAVPLTFSDQPVAREVVDTAANTLPTSYVDGRISLNMAPTLTATPLMPNSNDEIVVAVRGTWTDGCRPAVPAVTRANDQVRITTTVTATVCTQALTPYALDVPLGRLPRGLYTIELVHQTPLATLRLGTLPLTVIGGMVSANAGSYNLESVAAESIVAVFGTDLATGTGAASTLPLPTTLAGTTLVVRDATGVERSAPLFYVSPSQVNYQIPPGTAPGRANLTLTSAAGIVSVGTITVAGIAPGLFSLDGSGRGLAAAYVVRVKAGGEVTGEQVWRLDGGALAPLPIDLGPASDQVFLVLFGTGFRSRTSLSAVTVTIGGLPAEVLYAGAAPDFIGLDQCNLRLDRQLIGRGAVEIEMMVDRLPANKVSITLK